MSPYGRVTLKTDLNLSPSVPLSVYFGAWLGATRAVYFRVKKGGQPKKKKKHGSVACFNFQFLSATEGRANAMRFEYVLPKMEV